MKVISHPDTYVCETCNTEFVSQTMARLCEQSPTVPEPCSPGQEVKLKNRNMGYTLAIVAKLEVKPSPYLTWNQKVSEEIASELLKSWKGAAWFPNSIQHDFLIVLDREVCLDHKWETESDRVESFYLLSEEQAASMKRMDNVNY